MSIVAVAVVVFLVNVPCGYLRARSEKLSKSWFLWVHLPIPFVIVLRIYSGLGFKLYTFPIIIGSYFLGQFIGGFFYRVFRTQVR